MKKNTRKDLVLSYAHTHKRCLSCGTDENMSRRKYCTIDCRQKLRYSLNMRTGLLRALSTKYATFYFTTSLIFLDVLPYGSKSIFSFLFPRSPGLKPVDDFATLSNLLGRAWWAENAAPTSAISQHSMFWKKPKTKILVPIRLNHMKLWNRPEWPNH